MMLFHCMTYMATPYLKNPCLGGHDIKNLEGLSLVINIYYTVIDWVRGQQQFCLTRGRICCTKPAAVASLTAQKSYSLIGYVNMMCVEFLNFIYYLSNWRSKHWKIHCTKWFKQHTHITYIIFIVFHFYAKVSDYRDVGPSILPIQNSNPPPPVNS